MSETQVLSRHNIFSRIRDSENWFLVNLLSRNADILSPEKAEEIRAGRYTDLPEYLAKGYLVDPREEERRYRRSYLDFLDARERSEVQVFFVPGYACNFACPYCYQSGYGRESRGADREVIDAFYRTLDRRYGAREGRRAGRPLYVTLFGGEPLLPGRAAEERIAALVGGAAERDLSLAVVTNGYTLADYLPVLRRGRIREVQVTLDGTEAVHDARRPLAGGGRTFTRIVEGIDRALEAGLPVNLRVVLDRENLADLPALARYAVDRGWTAHPRFKSQLGRNYELHTCQTGREKLYERVELYESHYRLAREHPEILQFHRPAYSVSGFLFERGELPDPLFDSCPGCKTEWAFDSTGHIYPCTATVGKEGEEVGTFHPQFRLDPQKIGAWEARDVTAIPECAGCALQLACGGGCAAVAKNRTGRLHAPDCRPVRELLEMGLRLYFEGGTTP
jgi:uncharacterized protein